jgi:predicted translin family RNA/ssDNA-binding protein
MVGGATFEEATKVAEFNNNNPSLRVILGGSCIHNSTSFLKEINNTYINAYIDVVIELMKPICEKIKTNDLYTGEKYVSVMSNYRKSIQECNDDEINLDSFIDLICLCLCDGIILYYNYKM